MVSFLSRYLDGEHEQVWAELLALGNQVREEPLYSDALAVAQETMRRVRYNIELLIPRLSELGYQFGFPDMGEDGVLVESFSPVFSPPAANVDDLIAFLEQEIGPLPLSLRVFYQVVGGVNLGGMDPGWQYEDACYGHDPLEVWPLDEDLVEDCLFNKLEEEDLEEEELEEAENLTAYHIVLAPDHYHKQGSSGGAPYEIAIPNLAIDAPLLDEWHNTTFVNYLRICFRWGGMPGFEACSVQPGKELTYLTRGLLSI
ncbi:MAG TPA: hypothetical protein VF099_00695 [Ktedonobacterales bacterium]